MVNILFGHHLLEPLWSIGVEELFYIIWAPLFKFLKKYLLIAILSVIAIKLLLLILSNAHNFPPNVSKVIRMLKFESMSIGGLAAYIIYYRKREVENSVLFSRIIQIVLILFIMGKCFASKFLINKSFIFDYLYNSDIFSHIILSCSFAWLIVNISLNKKSLISLDNRVFNFLGNISYGIYMYHMLIIFAIVLFFKNHLAKMSGVTSSALFYFVLTVGVILISFISKRIFEDYFLGLKQKFRPNKQTTKLLE